MFEGLPTSCDALFYHGDQKMIDYTPAADTAAGAIINLGSGRIGITLYEMKANILAAICVLGTFRVRKAAATDFVRGVGVGWNNSSKLAVAAGAGTFNIGVAEEASRDDADYVIVDINTASGYAT